MDIVLVMVDASDMAGKHDVAPLAVTTGTVHVYALTAKPAMSATSTVSAMSAVSVVSVVSEASDLLRMPVRSAEVDSY